MLPRLSSTTKSTARPVIVETNSLPTLVNASVAPVAILFSLHSKARTLLKSEVAKEAVTEQVLKNVSSAEETTGIHHRILAWMKWTPNRSVLVRLSSLRCTPPMRLCDKPSLDGSMVAYCILYIPLDKIILFQTRPSYSSTVNRLVRPPFSGRSFDMLASCQLSKCRLTCLLCLFLNSIVPKSHNPQRH